MGVIGKGRPSPAFVARKNRRMRCSEWFLIQNPKRVHMLKNELVSTENKWVNVTAAADQETGSGQSETTLTGEEKKIFDAVFAGAIIGAGLTALIFLLL